jgi:hypothetical protein
VSNTGGLAILDLVDTEDGADVDTGVNVRRTVKGVEDDAAGLLVARLLLLRRRNRAISLLLVRSAQALTDNDVTARVAPWDSSPPRPARAPWADRHGRMGINIAQSLALLGPGPSRIMAEWVRTDHQSSRRKPEDGNTSNSVKQEKRVQTCNHDERKGMSIPQLDNDVVCGNLSSRSSWASRLQVGMLPAFGYGSSHHVASHLPPRRGAPQGNMTPGGSHRCIRTV